MTYNMVYSGVVFQSFFSEFFPSPGLEFKEKLNHCCAGYWAGGDNKYAGRPDVTVKSSLGNLVVTDLSRKNSLSVCRVKAVCVNLFLDPA
ncbi:hypothetical protein CsSME_00025677 [Camellia sinensis var. sinensis]